MLRPITRDQFVVWNTCIYTICSFSSLAMQLNATESSCDVIRFIHENQRCCKCEEFWFTKNLIFPLNHNAWGLTDISASL
jgi:hypothetical protein